MLSNVCQCPLNKRFRPISVGQICRRNVGSVWKDVFESVENVESFLKKDPISSLNWIQLLPSIWRLSFALAGKCGHILIGSHRSRAWTLRRKKWNNFLSVLSKPTWSKIFCSLMAPTKPKPNITPLKCFHLVPFLSLCFKLFTSVLIAYF